MLQCEGFSSNLRYDFEILNGKNVWNWVANMILKLHDDPTVNGFEIVIFLRQVWWAAGKKLGYFNLTLLEKWREINNNSDTEYQRVTMRGKK